MPAFALRRPAEPVRIALHRNDLEPGEPTVYLEGISDLLALLT